MDTGIKSGERLCGKARVKGGVYMEVDTSPDGLPLSAFFVDPPVKVDLDALCISPIGTHVIESGPGTGIYNILDVIGSEHYPNVADFIEEGRSLGFSRRSSLSSPEAYAKLTKESRICFIHRRAYIENFEIFNPAMPQIHELGLRCPRGRHDTASSLTEMCVCLYHADVDIEQPEAFWDEGSDSLATLKTEGFAYRGKRKLPCGDEYTAFNPGLALDCKYHYALFLSLPLGRIVLVDPDGEYQNKLDLLRNTSVPVEVVDE